MRSLWKRLAYSLLFLVIVSLLFAGYMLIYHFDTLQRMALRPFVQAFGENLGRYFHEKYGIKISKKSKAIVSKKPDFLLKLVNFQNSLKPEIIATGAKLAGANGMAFGPDGKTTTDASIALKGTMAPAGGYKGFGMGLFVEIMSACLTGSNLGIEASSFANDKGDPPGTGQFFIAINPEKFSDNFEKKIEKVVQSIKNQENARVPGSKRIKNYQMNINSEINIKEELYNKIIYLNK